MPSPLTDTRVLTAPSAPFFASFPPVLAGFLRGVTFAVLIGAIEGAIHFLDTSQTLPPDIAIAAPIFVLLLRSVEGYIDHHSTSVSTPIAADAGPALYRTVDPPISTYTEAKLTTPTPEPTPPASDPVADAPKTETTPTSTGAA